MKLTISIDDVNPKKNWRILGEKTEDWMRDLHETYGVKYNLFIPSNHHNNAPISQNKKWVRELEETGMFELSAHGHYHNTSDKNKFGEMEFVDMNEQQCIERIKLMMGEWEKVEYKPKGWRNPGWLCQPYCVQHLSKEFEWAALHYEHNQNLKWDLKMIFGADGIHETDIKSHDDNIMFQSHIYGSWNKNEWTQSNYEQLKLSLDHLFNNFPITPLTISEL